MKELVRAIHKGVQMKVNKKTGFIKSWGTIGETALSIFERVLLVKTPLRIVFYRRTTLGLKPSFSKSLVTVSASFSVQKAPTKSLMSLLDALSGRL